jgi:hypothetical protein
MAQRVVVELTSDVSGGTADETVSFALDGVTYEIDLTTEEATELRTALTPYTEGGRKLGRTTAAKTARRSPTGNDYDASAVRAWAASNGVEISGRGRISKDVLEKYRAAGN